MAEQTASQGGAVESNPAEVTAVNVRNAVVLGQSLIQISVVGLQEIDDTAVFAHHFVEQELCLLPERLTQIVVKVREKTKVRSDRIQVSQVKPLIRKVGRQASRPRVGEHPAHLAFEHIGLS